MKSVLSAIFFRITLASFLNSDEIEISLNLIKELEIRRCIFVGDAKTQDLVSDIKKFSSGNIPTAQMNYDPLVELVERTRGAYFSTGLIFKEKNVENLKRIIKFFEKDLIRIDRTYKMRYFVWLIFLENETEITELMVPYDCEFIVIQAENAKGYRLMEIFTAKNRSFRLEYGKWDKNFGLKVSTVGFYARRYNFQGIKLRLITNKETIRFAYRPYGAESYKQTFDIIKGFAFMLNFTVVTIDLKVGNEEQHRILYQTGDICDLPNVLDNEVGDYPYLDTLGPISKIPVKWYIKYPKVELMSDFYLQPFDAYTWLTFLAILLFGTALILLIQILIQNENRNFPDNLFLCLEFFCGQCGNDNIENPSLRLISLALLLNTLMATCFYGAVVTSFFAVEMFQPPFTNLEDYLAHAGEYKIMRRTEDDIFLINMLNLANYSEFIPFGSREEYFERMCFGKYAVFDYGNMITDFHFPCRYYKIPESLTYLWHAVNLQGQSPFTKIFNENMVRFYEIGFQTRFRKMGTGEFLKDNFEEDSFKPIELEMMKQVLAMPLIGLLLGVAIFTMEIIITKFSRKRT